MKMLLLVPVAVLALVLACDDDHGHGPDIPPECEPIAERCHDVDTEEAQECHENAEGVWTAAECTANLADCNAKCPLPEDAGPR